MNHIPPPTTEILYLFLQIWFAGIAAGILYAWIRERIGCSDNSFHREPYYPALVVMWPVFCLIYGAAFLMLLIKDFVVRAWNWSLKVGR